MSLALRVRTFVVAALIAIGVLGVLRSIPLDVSTLPGGTDAPSLDPTYLETVRAFYGGLAALEVGLLEDAQRRFERAVELAPEEPAMRANLALVHIGFGNDEAATGELTAARDLAPSSSAVVFLQGQIAAFRARSDEAKAFFRETLALDPEHVRARFALAQELERDGGEALLEAQRELDSIIDLRPENLAVLVLRARVAAQREDGPGLRDTAQRLRMLTDGWAELAVTQLDALDDAVKVGDLGRAATLAQLLRNVLVRAPAFREDQAEVSVSAELIADPLVRFLELPSPVSTAAPPDDMLSYTPAPLGPDTGEGATTLRILPPGGDGGLAVFVADPTSVARVDGGRQEVLRFPDKANVVPPSSSGLQALDWDGDYRMDLAFTGSEGVRLMLQAEDGTFDEMIPVAAGELSPSSLESYGAWAADIEMDGDLDLVVAARAGPAWVMRNNADGTWNTSFPFGEVDRVRGFVWADFDLDGDPDAVLLDERGALHAFENRQGGRFEALPAPGLVGVLGLTVGDLDADGRLDLVSLDAEGVIARSTLWDTGWQSEEVVSWSASWDQASVGSHRILLADLDNNGALDVLGAGPRGTEIWLGNGRERFVMLSTDITTEIFDVLDLDGDGWLDLVGLDAGVPAQLRGRGTAGYGWQEIYPRAHVAAGDQRINAFGVGGEIEVRAGLLVQKQVLTGAPAHIGLGTYERADVTRISWPNGVTQADFEFGANQVIVAEQRLKGSCPWLFAHDGTEMRFVTDFLWRSPLGLRINAQDTADVAQTEDWVLIRGEQLAAVDGQYDLRVTAELWETHFFDHVSLLVVDHPPGTEVFVDERFSRVPAALEARITGPSRSALGAWDDMGREVTSLVTSRDARYVASFERGTHQGVTRDHYVEVALDLEAHQEGPAWLLAYGWVYPTDSSINVALGQGQHPAPRGVALEAQDPAGNWVVVHEDLGFPSGKQKTMVVELPRWEDGSLAARVRLRTNLEVYWDWIGHAPRLEDVPRMLHRLVPDLATLSYRGYSKTEFLGPRGLEIPRYEIANIRPRWRDLTGFHTRFGDVRELLAEVDDRYVIMNAGDELRFVFAAPEAPPEGWRRDFVLIGDGWVKDGDFNTTHAQTVGPLPSHDQPRYDPDVTAVLEDDPVFRRHSRDWLTHHTRYVTPERFLRGLGMVRD